MSQHNFHIAQSQIVFEYNLNFNVRKRVFEYEEALKEHFNSPFITFAIPDQLEPQIPRFEGISKNGHSKLQVSPLRLNFTTVYDELFKNNIEKIKEYFSERTPILETLVRKENVQYIAYVVELVFELPNKELNKFIKENTGVMVIDENTIDFTLRYSKPYLDHYFLNITCSKFVQQQFKVEKGVQIQTPIEKFGISVLIDLNTKYHSSKGQQFQEVFFNDIQKTIFNIVQNNHLVSFLNGSIK